jgi:hypothetical protein
MVDSMERGGWVFWSYVLICMMDGDGMCSFTAYYDLYGEIDRYLPGRYGIVSRCVPARISIEYYIPFHSISKSDIYTHWQPAPMKT